ncbi:MAG: PAS domain S-box protein, partial [Patescibacteria group bacterium]
MKKQNIFQPYDKVALRISVLYMIISALWIFFSDKLLVGDPRVVTYISIGKGWFYTVVVGFFFYFTISRIIKHHNQVECEARVSESNYRRLFETAKDGILLVDFKTGMILDVNPFLVDLLGYSKTDFLEKYLWDVGTFKDVAASKDNFLTLQEKKYVRFEDLPLETKSGKKINVEFVANAYDVEGVTIIQCNIRDITARKKAERDLSEAKISFLSVASHQLRTPLSITKWVLESLIRDKQATPQQTERFNYLVYSNERLINLVNDLLSVTEIDSGKLKVDKKM